MAKLLILSFVVWSVMIYCIIAMDAEDLQYAQLRALIDERVQKCMMDYNVSLNAVNEASSGNFDDVHPCFTGCVLSKMGVITKHNNYDPKTAIKISRGFLRHTKDRKSFAKIARRCDRVNEQNAHGQACERGMQAFSCFYKYVDDLYNPSPWYQITWEQTTDDDEDSSGDEDDDDDEENDDNGEIAFDDTDDDQMDDVDFEYVEPVEAGNQEQNYGFDKGLQSALDSILEYLFSSFNNDYDESRPLKFQDIIL